MEVGAELQSHSEHSLALLGHLPCILATHADVQVITYMVTALCTALPQIWELVAFQIEQAKEEIFHTGDFVICHMVAVRMSPEDDLLKAAGRVSDQYASCGTRSFAGFAQRPCFPLAAPFSD